VSAPRPESADGPFPVRHVADIDPQPAERQWLVDGLWLDQGVGILGGAPKCCKTWLAAEIACAVASGTPALGRFEVRRPGPALLFCAEDSPPTLRRRIEGLVAVRGHELAHVPLLLLDIGELRLDRATDVERLRATVVRTRPRLLVLDPFVRLARIDENSAAEVSAVLGALRRLQRDHELAVLVVHHARKSPASHPGQSLRGSSDFAAWGDSNLYLARRAGAIRLTLEHRSASALPPLDLVLATEPVTHLAIATRDVTATATATATTEPVDDLARDIMALLAERARPVTKNEIRDSLRRRNEDVRAALADLVARGLIRHVPDGWMLAPRQQA